jgi:hypothetical protein
MDAMTDINGNNVEHVEVLISAEMNAAILLLARDYKKGDASELAEDLLKQVVKGRLKAKREGAAKKLGEQYSAMISSFQGNTELLDLLPTRQDFINKELLKLDDAIRYL